MCANRNLRTIGGLTLEGGRYETALARQKSVQAGGAVIFEQCDVLCTPTQSLTAPPVTDIIDDAAADMAMVAKILRWTVPANDLGLCAVSLPIHHLGPPGTLPVGLQLHMPPNSDASVASVAKEVEAVLGVPPPAKVHKFIQK
eukprot:SAG31_NODE_1201_length_9418_cov_3.410881_3_plen_143_part_00